MKWNISVFRYVCFSSDKLILRSHILLQLFESEMRCALIEAETREEVMREMEERMRMMEEMYSRRLMSEVGCSHSRLLSLLSIKMQLERNEQKTDAKIDMLHQSGLFGSPTKASRHIPVDEDLSEEEDVEMSLVSVALIYVLSCIKRTSRLIMAKRTCRKTMKMIVPCQCRLWRPRQASCLGNLASLHNLSSKSELSSLTLLCCLQILRMHS